MSKPAALSRSGLLRAVKFLGAWVLDSHRDLSEPLTGGRMGKIDRGDPPRRGESEAGLIEVRIAHGTMLALHYFFCEHGVKCTVTCSANQLTPLDGRKSHLKRAKIPTTEGLPLDNKKMKAHALRE